MLAPNTDESENRMKTDGAYIGCVGIYVQDVMMSTPRHQQLPNQTDTHSHVAERNGRQNIGRK